MTIARVHAPRAAWPVKRPAAAYTAPPRGAAGPHPEAARLDAVKARVRADIADDRPDELALKRTLEAMRLSAAQALVQLARRWRAYAADPATFAAAEQAVKQTEAQLRTEYATRAALKAGPRKVAPAAPIRPVETERRTGGAAVWREPGVWVANADAFPSAIAIQRMKASGVKWVALQISDGTTLNDQTQRQLQAGFIQQLHAAGLKVGFWGVNRTAPEAEAQVMATEIKRWGADFFIANAELEYKYTSADGSWSPEAFGRSQRFVTAFRQAMPDIPAALSSYGRADTADLDWKVWRDNGFDWLPQAYLNDFATCDPKLTVEGGVKAGWPKDRIHPTLGLWGGGQSRVVPADEYAPSLRAAGTVGLSSYLAEQMSEEDWAGLGRMVAAGDLAR